MDPIYKYVLSAALGGLAGGLGHALVSDNLAAPKRDPITGDLNFGWIKNVFVGLFSGLVWLLPNQNTWSGDRSKGEPKDLILIALQTLIVGLAGSGWLTSYLQTKGLQGAVAKAAVAQPDPTVAGQIAGAKTVKDVLTLVNQLKP
jgi:hypothetical protein